MNVIVCQLWPLSCLYARTLFTISFIISFILFMLLFNFVPYTHIYFYWNALYRWRMKFVEMLRNFGFFFVVVWSQCNEFDVVLHETGVIDTQRVATYKSSHPINLLVIQIHTNLKTHQILLSTMCSMIPVIFSSHGFIVLFTLRSWL